MGKSEPVDKNDEEKKEKQLIPPDGGYGWVIVAAFGLNNIFIIPIIYAFGLVFVDKFKELGFEKADVTNLVSVNSWFGMILGIFGGPLLKKFGYRKMAFAGITLYILGFCCLGVSTEYYHFIIFYGMVNSAGYVLVIASFMLAINSYFKIKRSHANGRAAFITGIGPVLFPLLTSYLLQTYGVKWTVFLLSAITMNAYIGACLLQPIKWHMKKVKPEEMKIVIEEDKDNEDEVTENPIQSVDSIHLYGYEPYISDSRRSLSFRPSGKWLSQYSLSKSNDFKFYEIRRSASESNTKRNETNYGFTDSLIKINGNGTVKSVTEDEVFTSDAETEKVGCCKKSWLYFKNLYDLDLLADPIFINIVVGISIATIGEIFFSLLTPFILDELGLDLDQSAWFMSILAFTDTIARFLAPYIGDFLKFHSRTMYGGALFLLFLTRALLFLPANYEGLLTIAAALGLAKGIRTVYWVTVLPDYVPITKYASASAIQSLINGILLAASGPVIGAVISISGSYTYCIIACNFLTISTIILWLTEYVIVWYRNRRKTKILEEQSG